MQCVAECVAELQYVRHTQDSVFSWETVGGKRGKEGDRAERSSVAIVASNTQ